MSPTAAGPDAAPAGVDRSGGSSTTLTTAPGQSTDDDVDQGIIPEPNSGREPEEAGDRGGALQLGLLALILVGVGGIVALMVRESRRARPAGRG